MLLHLLSLGQNLLFPCCDKGAASKAEFNLRKVDKILAILKKVIPLNLVILANLVIPVNLVILVNLAFHTEEKDGNFVIFNTLHLIVLMSCRICHRRDVNFSKHATKNCLSVDEGHED